MSEDAGSGKELKSSADVSSRLPTFRGPRDLTLSRGSRLRRQYVPNIPPKREKTEVIAVKSKPPEVEFTEPSLPGPSELKNRRSRPIVPPGLGIYGEREGGGRRGRDARTALVQSTSVFSEGVGSNAASSSSSRQFSSRGIGRGRGGRGTGTKQVISSTDLEAVITKSSKQKRSPAVKDITPANEKEEDEDDDEPIGGYGGFLENVYQGPIPRNLQPMSLPLSNYHSQTSLFMSKAKVKVQEDTKQAKPGDSFSTFLRAAPPESLVLLKFPNKLPFRKESLEHDRKPPIKSVLQNDLRRMRGGRIGKIQILASGKSRLILSRAAAPENPASFEIESSKAIPFNQELVAIDQKRKNASMLGNVQHKFICIPDLEDLFQQIL